jgi:hypothetical protein
MAGRRVAQHQEEHRGHAHGDGRHAGEGAAPADRPNTTIEPISPAAQPAPISPRPKPSPRAPSAAANTSEPATAESSSPDITRRGPNRSSSTPAGICIAANIRKKTPVTAPIDSGEIESSRISSGAIAAFAVR